MERYKFPTLIFCALLAFSAAMFMSCGGDDDDSYPGSLTNAVYGGLNPAEAWVTVSFQNSIHSVCAISGNNSSTKYIFIYDSGTGKGSIFADADEWAPGAFELNSSGSVLTFTNFGGHNVSKKFNRLRKTDLSSEPSPSGLATLSNDLVGSTWGGSTPEKEGTAFLTLTYRAKVNVDLPYDTEYSEESWGLNNNVAVISYSHDNSTAVWNYNYADRTRAGSDFTDGHKHDGTSTTWQPGAYTISADGKKITFSNFGGHGGERSFNRYK